VRRCENQISSMSSFNVMRYVPSLRESHPNNEDELEDVVEREPVNSIDRRLNDGQEGVHDPVLHSLFSKTHMQTFKLLIAALLACSHTVSHCVSSALPDENSASRE
jgi:hypothetical protein